MNEFPTAMWWDDRFYRVKEEGLEYIIPSVTTKLGIEDKPFLYRWYADQGWDAARKKMHEAQERGVRIHYAWYVFLMGGVVIYNPFQRPNYSEEQIKALQSEHNGLIAILNDQSEMLALWKLQRFYEVTKAKIVELEMTVYSIKEDIAGTLDNVFFFEKGTYDVNGSKGLVIPESGVYICDLKSGNQVSESAWAQIAAYERAYVAMGKTVPKGGIVMHTNASTRKGIEGFSAELLTSEELKFHYKIYQHLSEVWKARNPKLGIKAFQFPTLITKKETHHGARPELVHQE